MTDNARFEVVATDAGWVARHIATAGKHTYTFETPRPFPTRHRALVAIYTIMRHTVQPTNGFPDDWSEMVQGPTRLLEVRDVDERTNAPHGSASTYANRRCRCHLCTDARATYVDSGVKEGEAS